MADQQFESAITDEMRALIGVKGPESVSELTTTSVRMSLDGRLRRPGLL